MAVNVSCHICGTTQVVAEQDLGQIGRCQSCGTEFLLIPDTRLRASADLDPGPAPAGELGEALPPAIGRFRVIRMLGKGGMGAVYLVHDPKLDRRVALKVPHSGQDRKRFLREARAAARFHHPNFCPIHDFGEADGQAFLVMAYIEGHPLSQGIIHGHPWESRKAVEVIQKLAVALAKAHQTGIIHRDLKPGNIMVDAQGGLIVMDFGLAREIGSDETSLTLPGAIVGTPAYMAPEQADPDPENPIGPRSDVYSLGVILYEMIAGRRPFVGSAKMVQAQLLTTDPPPISAHRPEVDPELETICRKAMARTVNNRYGSMADLAEALQCWLEGKSRTNSIGMKLMLIPAGEVMMGSDDSDPDAGDDEKPRHRVQITRPFYLSTTPVTVAQFRRFVQETGYRTEAERDGKGGYGWDEQAGAFRRCPNYTWRSPGFAQGDDHPVVIVSWNDAVAFCEWLGRHEGQVYRLPTEAEWEYSCRAGTSSRYWFGDDPEELASVGNVADGTAKERFPDWRTIEAKDGFVFTSPVGRFRANGFGLFDMHGNVWEWCSDGYDPEYYRQSPPSDPPGSSEVANRVFRGGGWDFDPRNCRSAGRSRGTPDFRSNNLGFRVARVRTGL
jgi:formylglycine-generating enzyme required for sulfatase activity/predicted Ser/Thr protein kinase